MKVLQLGKAFAPIKKLGGVEKVMEYFYYGLNESKINCDVLGANDSFNAKTDNYCEDGLVYREPLMFHAKSTFFSIHCINSKKVKCSSVISSNSCCLISSNMSE